MSVITKGQKWRYRGDNPRFFTKGKVYEILSDPDSSGQFSLSDDLYGGGSNSPHHWTDDETFRERFEPTTSPVRTVTHKVIEPGVYDAIEVKNVYFDGVNIVANPGKWSASNLRAAASTLIEIADALEQSK